MKYYKNNDGEVYAYDKGQTPIDGLTLMTKAQVEAHINPKPTAEQITKHIAVYRREKENGGITVSGVSVKTDTETRASLLGAVQLGTAIDWKTNNGFVTLTPAQISGIATAVGQHIQKCFSAEKAVTELHAETPYTTLDAIETAFDGAYNV